MPVGSTLLRVLLVVLLPLSTVKAQLGPTQTRQLAPGVHVVLSDPMGRISDSNVLVIINDADVLVVDANILPSSARHVIGEIRKLTDRPVRYLINTHWHSDHHYGNAVYQAEFPGVEIVQHRSTRDDVIARDVPTVKENVEVEYPKIIASYKQALVDGKLSDGREITPDRRKTVNELLVIYESFVREMAVTPVVPGTLVIEDSLVLHRGARRIVIKYLGRGNTAGDLVVHLPVEGIIATGDLVVHPVPFGYFSHLGDWSTTLRLLRTTGATTIVPGHGPVLSDWSFTDQLIQLIEYTWAQVRAAVASGADLESTKKRVNLDALRDRFTGTDARLRSSFANNFAGPAVEAAFSELRPDSVARRP